MKALVERANGLGAVVHRDADNLQAAIAIFLLQFHKVRGFLAAGSHQVAQKSRRTTLPR